MQRADCSTAGHRLWPDLSVDASYWKSAVREVQVMVQVSRVSQWRFDEDGASASTASPSNRRNQDAQPKAQPDLKWRPGLSRAECKVRAKEMRKHIAERSERREASRSARLSRSPLITADPPAEAALLPPPDPLPPPLVAPSTSVALYGLLPSELWLRVLAYLDTSGLVCAAGTCKHLQELAADDNLWTARWEQTFGRRDTLHFLPISSDRTPARERCVLSEAALVAWKRATPTELALPGMTAVSISGLSSEIGASCHNGSGGPMVRLWECPSGRRLAAHQHKHKHKLTCCALQLDEYVARLAVGDAAGAVHLYRELDELHAVPLGRLDEEVTALAMWPGQVVAATPSGLVASFHNSPQLSWSLRLGGADGAVHRVRGLARTDCNAELYAAGGACVWRMDVERAVVVSSSDDDDLAANLAEGLSTIDLAEGTGTAPTAGVRGACFSPGWRLLASSAGSTVRLYDMREHVRGPAGIVHLPGGSAAGSVHLDHGLRGSCRAGQMLVSSASGYVHIFDLRRVSTSGETSHIGSLAPAPPQRLPPCACFDVSGCALVVGGGVKSSGAFRFSTRMAADESDEEDEPSGLPHSGGGGSTSRSSKSKPARQTKKQWSHGKSSGRGAGPRGS